MKRDLGNTLLSPDETAARLGVSRKTVDRHWETWGLNKIFLGRRTVRFDEKEVEAFIGKGGRTFEC